VSLGREIRRGTTASWNTRIRRQLSLGREIRMGTTASWNTRIRRQLSLGREIRRGTTASWNTRIRRKLSFKKRPNYDNDTLRSADFMTMGDVCIPATIGRYDFWDYVTVTMNVTTS
jgi:hypothetical protein